MQIYRGLDIGTAKPDRSILEKIPHHLIDIIEPEQVFGVGDFVERADSAVKDIISRGRIPLLSGGTAFYFRNFMFGMPEAPKSDPAVREELMRELADSGLESLFSELLRKDPLRASQLHPNDRTRIIRALEVFRSTGKSQTEFAVSRTSRSGYRFLSLGLRRDREELYGRINRRVDMMFDAGLENEIAALRKSGITGDAPGMKGIGYREFFSSPGNERELIKRNSRRYAKRQITFFSSLPDVKWIHPERRGEVQTAVKDFLER
jgi:tRNA dimethylallyltransferase